MPHSTPRTPIENLLFKVESGFTAVVSKLRQHTRESRVSHLHRMATLLRDRSGSPGLRTPTLNKGQRKEHAGRDTDAVRLRRGAVAVQ